MSGLETTARDWAELAALQRNLRALDRGEVPEAADLSTSRAVRARLIRHAIAEQKQQEKDAAARRGLQALQQRMDRIVADARDAHQRPWGRTAPSFDRERRSGSEVYWSPHPVLAFRAWAVRALLHGVVGVWQEPAYRAGCFGRGGERRDPSVPHTDGSCGSPPCGLYTVKAAEMLVKEIGLPLGHSRIAFGVVELTGKVVEHTAGYRASHARAVALAIIGRGKLVRVEGEGRLRRLFAAPAATLVEIERSDPDRVEELSGRVTRTRLIEYLEQTRLLLDATTGAERN